jgi:beta-glucosidase
MYDNGRNQKPITINKPVLTNSTIEFVATSQEADVVLLWLIPNGGSLFGSTNKPIELSLSKNKIDVAHVNALIKDKPTVLAINYTSPWVIDEIDLVNTKAVLATFGTTQEALVDIVGGVYNPTGKMPFTTPVSVKAVLENQSDVPGYLKPKEYSLYKYGEGLSYGPKQ